MSLGIPFLLVAASLSTVLANSFFSADSAIHEAAQRSLESREDRAWETITEKACEGTETETSSCPAQLECHPCVPVDCEFGDWSSWSAASPTSLSGKDSTEALKCTSLCERSRKRTRFNSDCGKPCEGPLTQTQKCADDASCYPIPYDCVLSAWSTWSECESNTSQSTRTRSIDSESRRGGLACKGALTESLVCGAYTPNNCTLSQWSPWSTCSASCSGGVMTRKRHVAKHAARFGSTCGGTTHQEDLYQEDTCNTDRCADASDCVLGAWNEWSKCQSPTPQATLHEDSWGQRTRERIITAATRGGKPCSGAAQATEKCKKPAPLPADCLLAPWAQWGTCSKTCGGGQRHRSRLVVTPSAHGGTCPAASLSETAICNGQRCGVATNDCKLTDWTAWTGCPVTCGQGLQSRNRSTIVAMPGGYPCKSTSLSEMKVCGESDCKAKDCVWAEWRPWGNCSKTCGTGLMTRSRAIVSPPEYGGECEAHAVSERKPCSVIDCPVDCINGTWGNWLAWSPCSASCGYGYKSRTRAAGVAPNHCGFPAVGPFDQFTSCWQNSTGCEMYPDLDCTVSAWTPWSPCKDTCRPHTKRTRKVMVYAHGDGRSCDHMKLTELRTCPWTQATCPSKADCVFENWTALSTCTVSCGGGILEKVRRMVPLKNAGSGCKGSLTTVDKCNTQACPKLVSSLCIDCQWSQWSEWDTCLTWKGQRARRRHVEQMGNYCGRKCEDAASEETQGCEGLGLRPDFAYCTWAAWSAWDECPTSCDVGAQAKSRTRTLHRGVGKPSSYLVKTQATDGLKCEGRQGERDSCPVCKTCTPMDCAFSAWGEWEQGADIGLCERSRSVSTQNNECGKRCDGSLINTKKCPIVKVPVSCIMGLWSMWSACISNAGQRERYRHIKRIALNGGDCENSIKDTKPCNPLFIAEQDCRVSSWSIWSTCTATCHGGTQERGRRVDVQAVAPGKPCNATLQELRECNSGSCSPDSSGDCIFQAWGAWSTTCTGQNQRFRTRSLTLANLDGTPCTGPLRETERCASHNVDCELSAWTKYTACDTVCGVGMKERHRQVHQYPNHHGKACKVSSFNKSKATINKADAKFERSKLDNCDGDSACTDLVDVHPCNEDVACEGTIDCAVNEWKEWTFCTTKCGIGQQMRKRSLKHKRTLMGKACHQNMAETRACIGPQGLDCSTSCLWGSWSTWTHCTRKCGNGTRTRYRAIVTTPKNNGKACANKTMEELEHCSPQTCNEECTDGLWGEWSAWAPCTATCEGGFTWQTRTVAREASACGKPVGGMSQQVKKCNENIECKEQKDCQLGAWHMWGSCSSSCQGLRERLRSIIVHPAGDGIQCSGPLRQVQPCASSLFRPTECDNVAPSCILSTWTQFSPCSVSCGSGQSIRTRAIVQHSNCSGGLIETRGCNTPLCHKPVDCLWGDWTEWGTCDVCGGQRHRSRKMTKEGGFGGKLCKPELAAEVEKCPRTCHGTYLCVWADWSAWGACSKSCGLDAKRTRTRKLHLVVSGFDGNSSSRLWEDGETARLEDRVKELYRKNQHVETQRMQHLTIAFFSGCLSLVVIFLAVRPRRARHKSRQFSRDGDSAGICGSKPLVLVTEQPGITVTAV